MYILALAVTFLTVTIPLVRAYLLNAGSLSIQPASVANLTIAISAAMFALVLASVAVMRGRARKATMLAWAIFLIFTWMVSNFFAWDLGLLNGQRLNIYDFPVQAGMELLALATVSCLVVIFRRKLLSNIGMLAPFLTIWSAIALVPLIIDYAGARSALRSYGSAAFDLQDPKLVHFSRSSNIIIFLLDGLQANIAKELLVNRSGLAEKFSGFTFFQNTVSAFPSTQFSVPSLLTGLAYDNTRPVPDFLEEAYLSDGSIPYRLRTAGYDTRASLRYPESVSLHYVPLKDVWDNVFDRAYFVEDAASLIRVAAFNAMPLPFKAKLSDNIWFDSIVRMLPDDLFNAPAAKSETAKSECDPDSIELKEFTLTRDADKVDNIRSFEQLLTCSAADIDKPVFRYFHFQGAHLPFFIFRKGREQEISRKGQGQEPWYARAQIEQIAGIMELMGETMGRLKKIGIFEDAFIVIASDHGYGLPVDRSVYETGAPTGRGPAVERLKLICDSLSLMMIKPVRADQPLRYSNAPISPTDLPPSVLEAAGLEHSGESIRNISENARRVRYHYTYNNEGFYDVGYLKDLHRYRIDGSVWEKSAWSNGELVPKVGIEVAKTSPRPLGSYLFEVPLSRLVPDNGGKVTDVAEGVRLVTGSQMWGNYLLGPLRVDGDASYGKAIVRVELQVQEGDVVIAVENAAFGNQAIQINATPTNQIETVEIEVADLGVAGRFIVRNYREQPSIVTIHSIQVFRCRKPEWRCLEDR
jgi:Sulfatase